VKRRTIKQLAGGRRDVARRNLASEIASGRLNVRQMTPSERTEAKRRQAAAKERHPRG